MRYRIAAALIACFTLPGVAQTIVVGSQPQVANNALNGTAPNTVVDLSHPASADGTVTTASIHWFGKQCTGAFKVKFLRPNDPLLLQSFTVVAERGPFTAISRNLISLSPPVDLKRGDLIAVTALQPFAVCGAPAAAAEPESAVMQIAGDVSSGTFNGNYFRGQALAARATDTADVLEGVVTATGSLQGNFGSFFRTSLQIASPRGGTSTGKLVFHPAGVPASPNDQAYPYTVSSGNALAFTDIVQQMGQSGLGTMDVVSNDGFPPMVTARVYNDAGVSGTSGFTEDMLTPGAALHAGDFAILLTPADLTNFRANIGVRTFSAATTINVQYGFRSQSNKDFAANSFQQFSLAGFGDTTPVPNEQIFFFVLNGDAIIYMSTTDNHTNDSSVAFARRQ